MTKVIQDSNYNISLQDSPHFNMEQLKMQGTPWPSVKVNRAIENFKRWLKLQDNDEEEKEPLNKNSI